MANIFFIGATGHIGGEVLDAITSAHPNTVITALVRDDQKGKRLVEKFPSVTPLVGDLNSAATIEHAARDAGIVINTGPDVGSDVGIAAILRGLSPLPTKGYYIHTAGAALIWDEPNGNIKGDRIWDDIDDIEEITSMPETKTHRTTDKMVFDASSAINVAIVSPAGISGLSASTEHPTPLTIPHIVNAARSFNAGFTIGAGANMQAYLDVKDLAAIYLALLQDALRGPDSRNELWGPQAYYFGAAEELSFHEYMAALVPLLKDKGVLTTEEIKQIDIQAAVGRVGNEEVSVWRRHIAEMYGTSMRVRSSRAMKLFGWQPREKKIRETFPEVIEVFLRRGKH